MLQQLQHLLETIYDARCGHDVQAYLLTRREQLPVQRRARACDEELVLVGDASDARLGVFIDAAVLQRLKANNPLRQLCSANLADFWTALEGVSHFAYLMWNVGHQRAVSHLELELQAEVDKYIASLWLLRRQNPGYFPRELRRVLFERTAVRGNLDEGDQRLYAAANRYASRYCAQLERALDTTRAPLRRAAVTALRRFYRLGSTRKLQHIERMPARGLLAAV